MSLLCAGVFSTILYVVLAICVLLFMVLIHEFGHYVVGRMLGFKITEFSIGFGKAIFSKVNKRGEKISLRIFPLGGYCAFEGEGDDDEEEPSQKKDKEQKIEDKKIEEKTETKEIINEIKDIAVDDKEKVEESKPKYNPDAFNNQKAWKRLLVYGAGVFFNFLSAILFSFILLVSYGYDIPQVQSLNADYSYLYGDLKEGDIIWGVDGTKISFAFSGTLSTLLKEAGPDKDIELNVERDNKQITVVIRLEEKTTTDEAGNEVKQLVTGFTTKAYAHSFLEALGRSFELSFGFAWVVLKGFWQIITGQIAFSQLGGPISTISMISTITQSGFANFLVLLPLLAANLAVFNFLPIPALDGCHALFTLLEWIFRKPVVSRKVENYIHFYGLMVLLLFVVIVDIVHISIVGL